MQIALLILQFIALVLSVCIYRLVAKNGKKIDEIKETIDEFYAVEVEHYNDMYGRGTYAVVKEWFDTHDCTVEYVAANNPIDAYATEEPGENDNYTIINVFKVG